MTRKAKGKTGILKAMNDRTYKALERAGIAEAPIASLDYEQQLFALTPRTLLFQQSEEGEQQRVTLRDVTRIHSDQSGTLRVEAGERTAITASLLGYDPGRVQRFFQQVRDATARAKQSPAPAAPSFFDKGTRPAAPAESVIRIAAQPAPVSAAEPAPVASAAPTPAADAPAPEPEAWPAPAAREPLPETESPSPSLSQNELLHRTRALGGLSVTARVLALVLTLGALGMGHVMWHQLKQPITALWTVTIGIVTAVALLILAELLRFFGALGQTVAEQGRQRS